MEPLSTYATKEGWRNDWQQTKARFSDGLDLSDYVTSSENSQRGSAAVRLVAAIVLAPVGAYVGMKLGDVTGFGVGWITDHIPYVRDLGAWAAAQSGYTGFMKNAQEMDTFNQNFGAATGAVSGVWGGIWYPARLLFPKSE